MVLQLAASRQFLVGAAHMSFPGLGHIRADGGKYERIPVNYESDPGQH
ncbi:hypothetical protein [Paraburkholderia elongata]|uniref:Uncharacterized protein n=1 Tax=Paraburkholderia elongata TaxID=2675747 RepID=A0A972NMP9_9BURK|nr:hypothetical protein [Paraburkholderia elongata]NPT55118.1 hypothetical protein [Paraburkholderia elongata]